MITVIFANRKMIHVITVKKEMKNSRPWWVAFFIGIKTECSAYIKVT